MKPDAEGYYLIPIFSSEQTRGNHTYDDIAKAVRAACSRGPIPVTMGPLPTNEFELRCVDPSRICGIIKEPKFLEESEIIQGLFKATPGNQQFIDNLLSPQPPSFSIRQGSPRFGIRGLASHDKNGKLQMDQIISIDLLPE